MRARELYRRTSPRIFTTNPDDPEEGRTFIWAWTEWFERLEGESGAVDFTPVADSEESLRRLLAQEELELTEIDDDYADTVREEFLDQTPPFPDAPEQISGDYFPGEEQGGDTEHG